MTEQQQCAEGWYPAADRPGFERKWDGQRWTGQMRFAGGQKPPSPEPAPDGPSKRTSILIGAGALALVVGIIGVSKMNEGDDESTAAETSVATSASAPEKSDEEAAQRALSRAADRARNQASLAPVNAELQCEEMVTKQLKSPSTADFPEKHTTRPFGTGYEVRGVVDSQNGFGATVRSYFGCTSVPDGKGQYTVTVTELFTP